MPRAALSYIIRLHHSKSLLSIIQKSQKRHMNYSINLSFKYFLCEKKKLEFLTNFLYYVLNPIHLKHSLAKIQNESEKLCYFILPENSVSHCSEKIEELKKIITFLLSKGYSSNDIKEKFADYLKSGECSYTKLCILTKIDSNIIMLLPLLSLSETILEAIAQKSVKDRHYIKGFSNRILYLSHHLEVEPCQLISALVKHPKLLTVNFTRLENKMKILKDAYIDSKYIVKDLWIFNYSEDALSNRIQAALKAEVELKPWMLRCSERFFQSILLKHSEKQRILHGNDVNTYLAKKLDCNTNYISHMMERNKLLKSINILKLEQVIDFLFSKGYTAEEIRLFPRIFSSSVKTLEKRFNELQHLKNTLPSLSLLCLSNKRLASKINRLKLTENY